MVTEFSVFTFDSVAFINLVISSVVGVLSGLLISHFYWKKNAPVERILKELKRVLPHYLHPVRYPQFYSQSSKRVTADQEPPLDTDFPHIVYSIFSSNSIKVDTSFEVLFAIVDTGRNFENPEGISVQDHLGRSITSEFCGLGFASSTFVAAPHGEEVNSKITVTLVDTAGNRTVQTFSFNIVP